MVAELTRSIDPESGIHPLIIKTMASMVPLRCGGVVFSSKNSVVKFDGTS